MVPKVRCRVSLRARVCDRVRFCIYLLVSVCGCGSRPIFASSTKENSPPSSATVRNVRCHRCASLIARRLVPTDRPQANSHTCIRFDLGRTLLCNHELSQYQRVRRISFRRGSAGHKLMFGVAGVPNCFDSICILYTCDRKHSRFRCHDDVKSSSSDGFRCVHRQDPTKTSLASGAVVFSVAIKKNTASRTDGRLTVDRQKETQRRGG